MIKYLSAVEVERKRALPSGKISELCRRRLVTGKKVGAEWFVDEASLAEYLSEHPPVKLAHAERGALRRLSLLVTALALLVSFNFIFSPHTARWQAAGEAAVAVRVTRLGQVASVATGEVFSGVLEKLFEFKVSAIVWLINTRELANNFFPWFTDNAAYYYRKVVSNWQFFLSGEGRRQMGATATYLNELTRIGLKQEILNELRAELGASGAPGVPAARLPNQGLVVIPATGEAANDEAVKNNLKNIFSDEVRVNFDPSGAAGVITPVFRDTVGGGYLFILTPLKP